MTLTPKQVFGHKLAGISWALLILLCLSWEIWLAPLRSGGSWLALKALPLLFLAKGMIKRDNYTLQWGSMLVWLYFTEGIVRGFSDTNPVSAWLAIGELVLSLVLFAGIALYLYPMKKAAKRLKKAAEPRTE